MTGLIGSIGFGMPPTLVDAYTTANGITAAHVGLITNHNVIRALLAAKGYPFESDGRSETIAHLVHDFRKKGGSLLRALRQAGAVLTGSFAAAVTSPTDPDCLVVTAQTGPLLIGIGAGEKRVATDVAALTPVMRRCIVLEDGDVAELRRDDLIIVNRSGQAVLRPLRKLEAGIVSSAVVPGRPAATAQEPFTGRGF